MPLLSPITARIVADLTQQRRFLIAALSHRVFRVFARRFPMGVLLSDTIADVEGKLNHRDGGFFHSSEGGNSSLVLIGEVNATMENLFVVAGFLLPARILVSGSENIMIILKTSSGKNIGLLCLQIAPLVNSFSW